MRQSTDNPVILGNAPSSGSTLLANLIGRAPGIYRRNELGIFDKASWLEADAGTFQNEWQSWFRKGYPRRFGCETRVAFTDYDAPPPEPRQGEDYLTYLLRFMNGLASESGVDRWIEKTPANIFSFPKLLERLPNGRFIIIQRDARSVVKSLMRRGFSASQSAVYWYLPSLAVHAVARDPRVLLVRYEALVESPDSALRQIFAFIGEDFDPAGLETAPAAESTTFSSWRAAPDQKVSASALWREGQRLPDLAMEALTRLRATRQFEAWLKVERAPTPIELQEMFGYPTSAMHSGVRSIALARSRAGDLARYYGSFARHGLVPRAIPFKFN